MITKISDLNVEMASLIEKLKSGEISPDLASEINKAASNMIRCCQVQINYSLARGESPHVKFCAMDASNQA